MADKRVKQKYRSLSCDPALSVHDNVNHHQNNKRDQIPLRAYIFTSTSGKSIVCFVEEAPVVLVRTYLSTEGVVRVGHSKLETVGKFYCISCAL